MRQQFAFYKSFDDVYKDLSDKQKIEFMDTLLDVQFLRSRIQDVAFDDVILKHIWNAQKHSLEKSINGYLESQKNGKIKEPYLGCYDDSFLPLRIPSEGVHKEEQEKGKEKGKEKGEEKGEVKEQEKGVAIASAMDYDLPIGTDKELFNDFLRMRKKLKAPNTQRAMKSLISKLQEIMAKGFHPNQIIQNSYDNGWKGLFEPKQHTQHKSFKQQDKEAIDISVENFMRMKEQGFNLQEELIKQAERENQNKGRHNELNQDRTNKGVNKVIKN